MSNRTCVHLDVYLCLPVARCGQQHRQEQENHNEHHNKDESKQVGYWCYNHSAPYCYCSGPLFQISQVTKLLVCEFCLFFFNFIECM